MLQINEVKTLLSTPKKIVITCHRKPDGDAIGSSLGLYHFLLAKQHEVTVVTPTNYAYFLHFLPGDEQVVVFEEDKPKATALFEEADIIFMLDFNALHRVEDLGDVIAATSGIKMMIDHHIGPDLPVQFMLWDVKASSTAELVYEFIDALGEQEYLNAAAAEAIYTGIVSDTGRFRHNTTPRLHQITADLLTYSFDTLSIHTQLFENIPPDKMRFIGFCLNERLVYYPEYHTAFIYVRDIDLKRFNYQVGFTEGLVHYPLSMEGVIFAGLIIERRDLIKLSLRSKGDFSVNSFAAKYFNGGGHKNAAGGSSKLTLTQTLDKFVALLPEYEGELKKNA